MNDLAQFIHATQDHRELKRALAVKMTLEKRPWDDVARDLGVTRGFISKWRVKYTKGGVESFRMGYRGSTGHLTAEERADVIQWLRAQNRWSVDELSRHLDARYNVIYRSRQSYYNLMHEARLSRKNPQKKNPDE